ncbi:hypothetical protein RRG08_034919 [Elysia crispata]|uniref:Uncharacterized protein n=1 Tax=Elysia crispata TaxID=231223 RepID=A0AAE0YRD1_9GAST|nr:hypothetical protein RRG08_034919 [Elysia crispata]
MYVSELPIIGFVIPLKPQKMDAKGVEVSLIRLDRFLDSACKGRDKEGESEGKLTEYKQDRIYGQSTRGTAAIGPQERRFEMRSGDSVSATVNNSRLPLASSCHHRMAASCLPLACHQPITSTGLWSYRKS